MLLTCGVGSVGSARADVFYLANEGQLQGKWLNREEVPRRSYVVETAPGVQVTLDKSQVKRVERQSPALAEYEAVRADYADNVEDQWSLAEWCRQRKLESQRREHLERVVALDPNHYDARRMLGYQLVDQEWKTRDQIMAERGYVRDGGKYKTQQQIEIERRDEKEKLAEQEWVHRLKRWRQELDDPALRPAAADSIRNIDDPFAVRALHQCLKGETSEFERECIVEALARIPAGGATSLLVGLMIEDESSQVRLSAIDALPVERREEALKILARGLKSKNNDYVNRAAVALGALSDPEAIGPLIEALVTTHKFKVNQAAPGGMGQTFARPNANGVVQQPMSPGMSGGGSFSFGGSTRVVKEQLQNRDVLDALIRLAHVNFEYDVSTWKRWFASTQRKSEALDARRD